MNASRATGGLAGPFAFAFLALLWLAAQAAWIRRDEALPDGDVMANVGALELFWSMAHEGPGLRALWLGYVQDWGENPVLYPAVTGVLAARIGVRDLDGDGPALLGLLWGVLALAGTGSLGRRLGGGRAGFAAAALLALSPLWSGVQRQVLTENAAVAMVACSAAVLLGAERGRATGAGRGGSGAWGGMAGWGAWALGGAFAGGALLSKHSAVLGLLPTLAVLPWVQRRGEGAGAGAPSSADGAMDRAAAGTEGDSERSAAARPFAGPALAALSAGLVAGPWYLLHLRGDEGYLLRSAGANPATAGWLGQAALYPAALAQQVFAPAGWAGIAVAALLARRAPPRAARVAGLGVLLGLLVLLLVPKKYPRLLLPLLPLFCAGLGAWMAGWPTRIRSILLAFLLAGALASAGDFGPVSRALGTTDAGLGGYDERCFQDFVRPPSRPGLDWASLLALLEDAGGGDGRWRAGAIRWPAAPCDYGTTHDLSEHLRIRVRRAGSEGEVMAGEALEGAESWPPGRVPDVLLHDGVFRCADWPAACAGRGEPREAGVVRFEHPAWRLDLHVYGWDADG